MKAGQFAAGLGLGAILGALATAGVYRANEKPVQLDISGTARVDTATHEDSHLDNSLYVDRAVLQGPVYLWSETIDINDLYRFADKPVRISGRASTTLLKAGYSVVELEITKITPDPESRGHE